MRITLIKSTQQGIKALEMNRAKIIATLILAALTLVTIVVITVAVTKWSVQQNLVSEAAINQWSQELNTQRQQLASAKARSEQQIQALSSRLATMQAHILRLDAVGNRVANDMGIADEFAFNDKPAIGGAEASETAITPSFNEVSSSLDKLENSILAQEQQLSALEAIVFDKDINAEQKISGRPIKKGWLSSPYGNRADPFTGKKDWHPGIDFAALSGSEVIATAAGVVTSVGVKSGYGKFIEINHGDGYSTRYAHNKELLVEKGDMIKKGQVIAKVGNTGRSTGPHVHYEVMRNGRKLNPYRYIKQ
ncbi:M23 family metallopeptidase [Kangiella sp. HZ709]|uniref:M23 family metallopeptidase n=1 Tax=Kangiella sp. HZ709 TaxID=2666328 RepID=UPI0012B01C21|nr:M23 family metallopeptidase [Kangiella sp. HZ709]MRX27414.1 peptidoglycan DD-metalloendopeptidase family protein [Kangiella sp. HZ709]